MADGIGPSYFGAGTSIAGLYSKIATADGNAFVDTRVRAINTGGTGATTAIGYITAKTGLATQKNGVDGSFFTTSGSIGAIECDRFCNT